ncbi:MAG: dihydrolipoamide acetyltransferase family protein [Microbacteriaceae bacterium]
MSVFRLPDLGEGLTESELVSWRVVVGDSVELNQIIAEVETAKALVELPSPFAGVISQLYGEPGATILVGAPLVAFELDGGVAAAEPVADGDADAVSDPDSDSASASDSDSASAPDSASAKPERTAVLVGYGPAVESSARPTRKSRSGQVAAPAASAAPTPAPAPAPVAAPAAEMVHDQALPSERSETPRSTPPVRALAAQLGVTLATVTGTGDDGLITRDDVQRAAGAAASAPTAVTSPAQLERETRTPIAGVRKHTAAAMVASAFTAPHVTVFLEVDVTRTVRLIEKLRASPAFAEKRLTMLTIVAKAVTLGIAQQPSVNARWDAATNEIVQFGYVNLGIAAATPRGLMVPNIKDAHDLTLSELADALSELVATARSGKTSPANLSGGTISISNVGVFGVDAGTPILNPGEAAILAIGAVRRRPWEHRGKLKLRHVMTLSLSFDHRLVDGEQGSRFLASVGALLEEPGTALAR